MVWEVLAGRPVPRRIKDVLVGVAFSILLLFGAGTLVSDLIKIDQPIEVFMERRPPPPAPQVGEK